MVTFLGNTFRFTKALSYKPFALLWSGQAISRLGDGAYTTAIAWQILLLTGSATAMGIVLVASSIPMIAFLLIGGVVADRIPKQLILICSDGGRAVAILVIAALSFFHILQLWELVVLAMFFGLAQGFFYPAYQAIRSELVERDALASANSLTDLSRQLGTLLGPLLGAACISLIGPAGAFAFDGLTFIVSVSCLLILFTTTRTRNANASSSRTGVEGADETQPATSIAHPTRGMHKVFTDLHEGLLYVIRSPWLWITIAVSALGNIGLLGPLQVALPKLVYNVYGVGVWLLGTVATVNAVGALLGTLLIGQMPDLRGRGLLAYLGLIISNVGIIAFGLPLPKPVEPLAACIGGALVGFGLSIFGVIWITVLQTLVPNEKLGRVFSIDALGSYCLLPVGYLLAGTLTDRIGPAQVFIIGGVFDLVLISLALCVREIRQME